MNLSNKTIVITGASKGLGRETALRLCRSNPDIVLVARSGSLLEQTQKEIENRTGRKPLIIPCDVSNETDVHRMAGIIDENFKHVDVLINNAGIGIHKISEKMSNDEMRKQFEVNFYGPFYCIKALLPLLKCSGAAYILNIDSLVSEISFADNSVYAGTKSALAVFSEGLQCEMKELNISVGLFLPGLMDTTFQHDREDTVKVPRFMVLDPGKAAVKLEKMITYRRKKVYMYKWMLLLMKAKQIFR
ncbi:MAG: SDR family NAD(P)-dependent oxidoreductase [Spirochaetes bacterium]|nr:SDR family NAD(P)-dependent oxidoreductase [Spirochaetota bacterium]